MRAQIEPYFEHARKYMMKFEQILAYTNYCDEFGDEDGEEYRKVEERLAKISGKDMSKFSLHEWWEAEGAENLAFDIALPEPKVVPDITKDELRQIVERMLAPVPNLMMIFRGILCKSKICLQRCIFCRVFEAKFCQNIWL